MVRNLKWITLALALCVAGFAFAGGVTDPSGPPPDGGGGAPPAQPGTIAGSASAYYGPVKCFGARGVVFFVTTTDADSLASATVEVSDDNIKYYAVSSAVGGNGTVSTVNLANKSINGRVARVTYFPTIDASAAKPWSSFITDRYIKLKLTANGNQIDGVAVHPVVISETWTPEDMLNAVYSWTLPQ